LQRHRRATTRFQHLAVVPSKANFSCFGNHPDLESRLTFHEKWVLDEYAPAGIGRSTLGGQNCNPYDTKRITGGFSAGSAAAVAANLAICALGTDTTGSVRYPSSLNALVGMVATQGLVRRAGIVPLTFSRDRGGPMCRTVEDTAVMLEVLAGDVPRDVITAVAHGKQPVVYSNYTGRHSHAGKRLGVVRDFMIEATIADRENIRSGFCGRGVRANSLTGISSREEQDSGSRVG